MRPIEPLTPEEQDRYQWQLWTADFGEQGQAKLKASTVLVSRIGGVGGTVAMLLAAAGVGKLILAHGGDIRRDDLNRQLLMSTDEIGHSRVAAAARRLQALNPHVQVETIAENITEGNVVELVERADLLVGAAPLFAERWLLNREAIRQRKPLIDCAMYDLEGRLMTIIAEKTPCLECLYPTAPDWKREFPVFGAVASTVASLAAMQAVKLLARFGDPALGRLLMFDLREVRFHSIDITRRADCAICGGIPAVDQ